MLVGHVIYVGNVYLELLFQSMVLAAIIMSISVFSHSLVCVSLPFEAFDEFDCNDNNC